MRLTVRGRRRPLIIDIPAAIQLLDDLRRELDELAGGKCDREDVEGTAALPPGVEGYDPDLHHPLDQNTCTAPVWAALNDDRWPSYRTDVTR